MSVRQTGSGTNFQHFSTEGKGFHVKYIKMLKSTTLNSAEVAWALDWQHDL